MAVYEVTLRSGTTISFKAKRFVASYNTLEWQNYEGQKEDKLLRLKLDEIVAVVERKG